MAKDFTVASTAQLLGYQLPKDHMYDNADEIKVLDFVRQALQTPKAPERTVHFTPSTVRRDEGDDTSPGTEVFTHSRHASWRTSNSVSAIPESLGKHAPHGPETLKSVRYHSPSGSAEKVDSVLDVSPSDVSDEEIKPQAPRCEARAELPQEVSKPKADLTIDTTGHLRQESTSSTTSSRRRRREGEIYFTPTDVTKSQIFLSSPKTSPPFSHDAANPETEEHNPPAPSTSQSIGGRIRQPVPRRRGKRPKLKPAQLNQLVLALAQSRMMRKHVRRHWWDPDDIPDDKEVPFVSTPTLTGTSTLYSRPNEPFVQEYVPNGSKPAPTTTPLPTQNVPPGHIGGVVLTDPKIHGSPVRFISKDYRPGSLSLSLGSCTYLNVPYGTDSECTLRVDIQPTCTVTLRCVSQVVDRKSGGKTLLLAADLDVTESFRTAALAELSHSSDAPLSIISVVPSPTDPLPEGPDVDWAAMIDEMTEEDIAAQAVGEALEAIGTLDKETCSERTRELMARLDILRIQHQDFLVLRSTRFQGEGRVPTSMGVRSVSKKLWHDWYEGEKAQGHSDAARAFREELMEKVAKHSSEGGTDGQRFTVVVKWEDVAMVVSCVALRGGISGDERRIDAWVCFVQGDSESVADEEVEEVTMISDG